MNGGRVGQVGIFAVALGASLRRDTPVSPSSNSTANSTETGEMGVEELRYAAPPAVNSVARVNNMEPSEEGGNDEDLRCASFALYRHMMPVQGT